MAPMYMLYVLQWPLHYATCCIAHINDMCLVANISRSEAWARHERDSTYWVADIKGIKATNAVCPHQHKNDQYFRRHRGTDFEFYFLQRCKPWNSHTVSICYLDTSLLVTPCVSDWQHAPRDRHSDWPLVNAEAHHNNTKRPFPATNSGNKLITAVMLCCPLLCCNFDLSKHGDECNVTLHRANLCTLCKAPRG